MLLVPMAVTAQGIAPALIRSMSMEPIFPPCPSMTTTVIPIPPLPLWPYGNTESTPSQEEILFYPAATNDSYGFIIAFLGKTLPLSPLPKGEILSQAGLYILRCRQRICLRQGTKPTLYSWRML